MNNSKLNKGKSNTFFIIILVFAILSSCAVGIFIGKSGEKQIDTIYLREPQDDVSFNIEGHLLYKDGSPVKNSNLELHSKVVKSSTNENGYFLAKDINPGDHKIFLFDKNGQELASCSFSLNVNSSMDGITVESGSDGNKHINTTSDISSLQIFLEIDDDGNLILSQYMILKTKDGTRITSDGVKIKTDGTILMPDGSMIDVNKILTLADGTKYKIGDDIYKNDLGMVILKDGSIITDSHGFVIGKDNSVNIVGSNGYQVSDEIKINNNKDVVLPDGSIVKQGEQWKDTSSSSNQIDENSSSDTNANTSSSSSSSNSNDISFSRPNFGSGSSSSSSSSSETSSTPVNPPSKGSIWFQQANLKIFTDSSYSSGTTMKDGVMIISPGSSGIYEFRINSDSQRDINFIMNINKSTSSPELPIFFRMTNGSGDYLIGDDNTWVTMEQFSQTQISDRIGPQKSNLYRVEWSWITQSDSSDTMFGTDYAGSDYTVDVTLKAST